MKRTAAIDLETRLQRFAKFARRRADIRGYLNYGTDPPERLAPFTYDLVFRGFGVRVMFTRDADMHMGGWLKNPDYERCYHLSVSYRTPDGRYPLPHDHRFSKTLIEHFYGDNRRWLWCEPPFSERGKRLGVWHYRLFCDEHWQPIKPRGEVYSIELTERGWKSFSEIHGHAPLVAETVD